MILQLPFDRYLSYVNIGQYRLPLNYLPAPGRIIYSWLLFHWYRSGFGLSFSGKWHLYSCTGSRGTSLCQKFPSI